MLSLFSNLDNLLPNSINCCFSAIYFLLLFLDIVTTTLFSFRVNRSLGKNSLISTVLLSVLSYAIYLALSDLLSKTRPTMYLSLSNLVPNGKNGEV